MTTSDNFIYEQPAADNILFYMLYAAVTTMNIIACCYLLFRRGNAFATDVTPPVHLRQRTAMFFAVLALGHLWYLPVVFLTSSDDVKQAYFVGGLLDVTFFLPMAVVVLISMLQDRRRPLWPIAVMIAPLVAGMLLCVVNHSDNFMPTIYVYLLILFIVLVIYMVRATRQYGRWLRDNYADLEHKEVWKSFLVLSVILLFLIYYASGFVNKYYKYIIQLITAVLTYYLLWRVETLSDLSISQSPSSPVKEEASIIEEIKDKGLPQATYDSINSLLQQYCIDTQLYLQHDLSLQQLAQAIGTNRFYLSQYFSRQDMTYNAYINDLRVNYFITHYHQAVQKGNNVSAQQLAKDSGYRSYSTFSLAFKQRMGQSVTAWMRSVEE